MDISVGHFSNQDTALTLELPRSLESLLLFLPCDPSTDFSLLCERDLDSLCSLSREPRLVDDDDFSSFKSRHRVRSRIFTCHGKTSPTFLLLSFPSAAAVPLLVVVVALDPFSAALFLLAVWKSVSFMI